MSGKVTLGNEPLKSGTVQFHPDQTKGNTATVLPVGEIGEDGTYTIKTNGVAGAPRGAYKVTIIAFGPPKKPNDMYSERPNLINRKYGLEDQTELTVDVISNPEAGHYDFKVTK